MRHNKVQTFPGAAPSLARFGSASNLGQMVT